MSRQSPTRRRCLLIACCVCFVASIIVCLSSLHAVSLTNSPTSLIESVLGGIGGIISSVSLLLIHESMPG